VIAFTTAYFTDLVIVAPLLTKYRRVLVTVEGVVLTEYFSDLVIAVTAVIMVYFRDFVIVKAVAVGAKISIELPLYPLFDVVADWTIEPSLVVLSFVFKHTSVATEACLVYPLGAVLQAVTVR
jgi:hypothetical protein